MVFFHCVQIRPPRGKEYQLTDGLVGTALGDDARGSITLDLGEVLLLADASKVRGGARSDLLDGVVKAGKSARGDLVAVLGRGQSGHGDSGDSDELHFEGIKEVC